MSRKKKRKQIPQELTIEMAQKSNLYSYGGVLQNPDRVLKKRGGLLGLDTYSNLEEDAHVRTVLSKRKRAVIAREWFVNEADSDDPKAVAAAELVREIMSDAKIDKVSKGLLDAVLKGFAVAEVIWQYVDGLIKPVKLKVRKQSRFIFADTENGYELRLLTPEHPMLGIPVPERKFIVFTFDERYENPYGLGLGNCIFWPVFFKRKGISFWLTFCDKFGNPTSVGKYPPTATKKERSTLREALEAIAQDAGVIVPDGMEITLLEAAKSGIDSYEKLVRYMDEQISEAVLGETGTTNQTGDGGSRARDQVGNEIRLETAKSDGDMLCECLNETLVKWIIELNMPGAPMPKFWRDFSEPEDLLQKAVRDTRLISSGQIRFKKEYWMREYNFQNDDFDIVDSSPNRMPVGNAAFAEGDAKNKGIDKFVDEISKKSGSSIEKMLKPLQKLVNEAKSFDEIQNKLLDLYGKMDEETFGILMQNAMVLSELKGRSEVVDGQ